MVGIVLAYAVAAVAPNMEAANALLPTYVTTCLYFGVPAQLLWFYLSKFEGWSMDEKRSGLGHMSGAVMWVTWPGRSLSKSNELESQTDHNTVRRGCTDVRPSWFYSKCRDVLWCFVDLNFVVCTCRALLKRFEDIWTLDTVFLHWFLQSLNSEQLTSTVLWFNSRFQVWYMEKIRKDYIDCH